MTGRPRSPHGDATGGDETPSGRPPHGDGATSPRPRPAANVAQAQASADRALQAGRTGAAAARTGLLGSSRGIALHSRGGALSNREVLERAAGLPRTPETVQHYARLAGSTSGDRRWRSR